MNIYGNRIVFEGFVHRILHLYVIFIFPDSS